VVCDGVCSRFYCIPWSVLFSLYSYGLCLFLTPPVNSSPNNRSVIGAVATATAADCVQQHVYGGLSAGASSWFGQASLSCVIGRVAFCLSCRRDVLARVLSFFVVPFLFPFAAATGHGTMVLSVGKPPVSMLSRTGRSFCLHRVLFLGGLPCSFAFLVCVFFLFHLVAVVGLLCFIKRSLRLFCIHFATQDSYLRKGL